MSESGGFSLGWRQEERAARAALVALHADLVVRGPRLKICNDDYALKRNWKGSRARSACLETASPWCLRKLGCQGVKLASPTRKARPLTPHLAR
jgi:hypothetical protein